MEELNRRILWNNIGSYIIKAYLWTMFETACSFGKESIAIKNIYRKAISYEKKT